MRSVDGHVRVRGKWHRMHARDGLLRGDGTYLQLAEDVRLRGGRRDVRCDGRLLQRRGLQQRDDEVRLLGGRRSMQRAR